VRLAAAVLVAATIAYDALIAFMVWFTFAFYGTSGLGDWSVEVLIFWLIAASPIAATAYCVTKLRAIGRGERPRI
jgi:hypothetical protein